jgi:hypothetical protein
VTYDESGPFGWLCAEHAREAAERAARSGDPALADLADDLVKWADIKDGGAARSNADA